MKPLCKFFEYFWKIRTIYLSDSNSTIKKVY